MLARVQAARVVGAVRSRARTDPNAVVESTGGHVVQLSEVRARTSASNTKAADVRGRLDQAEGVTIVTDERNGGRTFTVTGKEGRVGKDESEMVLDGDVASARVATACRLRPSTRPMPRSDGIVRAPGPVEFMRAAGMTGSGVGMTYDKNHDVLVILDQAVMHMTPDATAEGASDITSGTATFARREKYVRFERGVRMLRSRSDHRVADSGVAHLSDDEKRIETRGVARQRGSPRPRRQPGALQSLSGRDIDLKYARRRRGDRARARSPATRSIQLAGENGHGGAADRRRPPRHRARAGRRDADRADRPRSGPAHVPGGAGQAGRTIAAMMLDGEASPRRADPRAVHRQTCSTASAARTSIATATVAGTLRRRR